MRSNEPSPLEPDETRPGYKKPKKKNGYARPFGGKDVALRSYDSKINRWTGKPHEHKREKARNAKRGN